MIIYLITNKINRKQYVGQTVRSLEERWRSHCYDNSGCLAIKSAIDKYGMENFIVESICEATSLEELNKKEEEFINNLNTLAPNGYNLKTGGDAPKFSEKSKAKMSLSHIGKKLPEHVRKLKSEAWKGDKNPNANGMSKEHKEKISKASKGNNSRKKVPIMCNETGKTYKSISHAAKDLNINIGHLHQVVNGKRNNAKGYTFSKVL